MSRAKNKQKAKMRRRKSRRAYLALVAFTATTPEVKFLGNFVRAVFAAIGRVGAETIRNAFPETVETSR